MKVEVRINLLQNSVNISKLLICLPIVIFKSIEQMQSKWNYCFKGESNLFLQTLKFKTFEIKHFK